ncbi:MAG: DUF58 domain-containing protein [Candidatus Omnitrophica bacterium]|jgi:uncharacterized protein (DUF58 family)|nr:DUF58 domain-containing protein [Candidatus Omnitrophota bacterium]
MARLFIKKWIFIGVLILAMPIIALKTGIAFFYFSSWFLLFFILGNIFWVVFSFVLLDVQIKRQFFPTAVEGETIEVQVSIKNKSLLGAYNILFQDNCPCGRHGQAEKNMPVWHIPAQSWFYVKYNLYCLRRGKYTLGPFHAYVLDPFGIFYLTVHLPVYDDLYVYPRIFRIEKFPELAKGNAPWFGIQTTRSIGEDDEFFGLREYRAGDSLRRVHWMSTARMNQVIVKQFQRQGFCRATIMFSLLHKYDLSSGEKRLSDYIVSLAASITKYLLDQGVSVELVAHTGSYARIDFNKGNEHMQEILKFLSVAQADSQTSVVELFEGHRRFLQHDSTVIIIMPDAEWEILSAAVPLDKRDFSFIPLVLLSASFLSNLSTERVIKDSQIKLLNSTTFSPVVLPCNQYFEEAFLR